MKKGKNNILPKQQKKSTKVEKALEAMKTSYDNEEQLLVCTLVKQTGLSRAFFYNNELVHTELVRLQKLQDGIDFATPKKVIYDNALAKENNLLKQQLNDKDKIIAQLQSEINNLEAKAKSHVLSLINEL